MSDEQIGNVSGGSRTQQGKHSHVKGIGGWGGTHGTGSGFAKRNRLVFKSQIYPRSAPTASEGCRGVSAAPPGQA